MINFIFTAWLHCFERRVNMLMRVVFFVFLSKFGFRRESSQTPGRGEVNKERWSNNNKRESKAIVWRRIPAPACLCFWKVPTTHTHAHTRTRTPEEKSVMFSPSYHHRYPAEVLQRALATHKVAKSSPFCVTAGNNTYTCLSRLVLWDPFVYQDGGEGGVRRAVRGNGG